MILLIISVFIIYGCKKEKINAPPTISIINPENGISITLGSIVNILVNAIDSDGEITAVKFFIDGVNIGSVANPPYSYEWNTIHVETGSHNLKAFATDNEGLEVSDDITVSLGNLPIVDFTSDKTNDTVPLTVRFKDLSTNDPSSWLWSFGDGGTSSEQNPSHNYADTGSFTVSLTSTNDYGSSTETKEDYIIGGSIVNANFIASDTNGIVPFTVYFTDQSSSNPNSWIWDFGDGATSTEQNPSHAFTEVGFYTIKLIATNSYGTDAEIKNNFIKGGAIPVAEFLTRSTNGVAPLKVEFTDFSTQNPDSWQWDFGDGGSSTEQNPTYIFNTPGIYSVSLTVTNEYGSNSLTKNNLIVVGSFPEAEFSVSDTTGTIPLTLSFIDHSSNNTTSWLWDFGDDGTSTVQNPSHTYTIAGRYDISLTSSNEYGSSTETKYKYITVLDIAPVVNVIDVSEESDWDYWVLGKEDYYYLQAENSIPKSVLFHSAEANKDYTVFFMADGLLDKLVVADHIFIFRNFVGTKVDIGIIYPESGMEILRGVESGYNWPALSLKSSNASETWSDLIGTTAELVVGIPCVLTAVQAQSTVGLESGILQWTCGNELLNLSINLSAQEIILHNGSGNFVNLYDINTTAVSCGTADPNSCINDIAVAAAQFSATQQVLIETKGAILEETETQLLAPIAEFTSNYTTGSAPLAITFTDLSTQSPSNWAWNFGDGGISAVQNPTHTYLEQGVYNVSLTVSNEFGTDVMTKTGYIVILNLPTANFTANKTSGAIPLSVSYTDLSTNTPTNWLWNFGDGQTSTLKNPSHTYSTAGTFTVSLTARNSHGSNTKTLTDYITTGSAPVSEFTATPTSGTAPLTVNFTDISDNNPTSWLWNFGDGTSANTKHTSHTYTTAGSYTITLTTTNQFGTNVVTKNDHIVVNVPDGTPVAQFTAAPTNGRVQLKVNFTDQSTNNPGYWLWDFGDGNKSIRQNLSYTYSRAGIYTVSLTVANSYGSDTIVKTNYITVTNEGSSPDAGFMANPTSGTVPLTVNFTDQSTYNPTNWLWSFGDGNTSPSQNLSHTYSAVGNYTVSLTATNSYGSNTIVKSNYITVTNEGSSPDAGFMASPTSGKVPLTVNFTDQSTNNPTSWTWNFGDGNTSNAQNPSHAYSNAGTYAVSLVATNSFGSDSEIKTGFIVVTQDISKLETSSITDVEANVYNTVKIGGQWWMAENLATTKYNDGIDIAYSTDWFFSTNPGYGWYDDDRNKYKDTYGALYNWNAVNTNKLCPIGWHVPSDSEWTMLTDYLGGAFVAGGKLKESGTEHWSSPNTGVTNESGFTALPGGSRSNYSSSMGSEGNWWSSTAVTGAAIGRSLFSYLNSVFSSTVPKSTGFSIRCVKD